MREFDKDQSFLRMNEEHLSTIDLLVGIWSNLSRRRRRQLGLLLIVMLISGFAELISLGAVLPFLSVLTAPQHLWRQESVQTFARYFALTQASQLLLPVTMGFVTAAVIAALIRLGNIWLNGRLAAAVGSDLACEAYRRTLYQPYSVHVQRNSASVITGTTTQIGLTVAALNSILQILSASVIAICLFFGVLMIDWAVALSTAALFGLAYYALAAITRLELLANSQKIALTSSQQLKALQEGLGAIRDILLDGTQHAYVKTYRRADRLNRRLDAKNFFLTIFPRYSLEAIGIVAIAILGCALVLHRGDGSTVLPLLGALALGAQRLLPALQQIYSGYASLKSYNAGVNGVLRMLDQSIPAVFDETQTFILRESIRLNNIDFRYSVDQPNILQALDLEIRCGERIALIGTTGSGKSTLIDIVMGLLQPTKGRITVDGKDLNDPLNPQLLYSWRRSIAHVPQTIYLADNSIAENIAFGVAPEDIDIQRVHQAAQHAQIASFIESIPRGYDTFVGERGVRLSGGQRQRIGIARALYKQAKILVFDEATSALDNATEKALIESINGLSKKLTIIMIAHRLSTIEACDRVIRIEQGKITFIGNPRDELSSRTDSGT